MPTNLLCGQQLIRVHGSNYIYQTGRYETYLRDARWTI
jgi:hypothetical protein